MLGKDGRLYDPDFDFDGDGKLNTYEYSIMVGLDRTELEYMDEDERREAIEDAGLDPDDYDFD